MGRATGGFGVAGFRRLKKNSSLELQRVLMAAGQSGEWFPGLILKVIIVQTGHESFKWMLVLVPLSTVIINPINPISKLFYWVPYTCIYIYIYTLHSHSQETTPSGCGFQRFGVRCASRWTFAGDLGPFFLPWWHDATRWVATVRWKMLTRVLQIVLHNCHLSFYHVIFGWWISIPACTPRMTLWLTILLKLYGNNHLSLPVVFH